MKKLSTALLATAAAVAILALAAPSAIAEDAGDAKTLFVETHKCNMCHGVAAAEIEAKTSSDKMKGPDLSGYKSEKSFEALAGFVKKNSQLDGKDHKKGFKGTDEELQTILDWLGSLEAQE